MKTRKHFGLLVAQLRKTIGISQLKFAAMIGVSIHTIISVENGRNELSVKLAKRIRATTGAELLNGGISFHPVTGIPHQANPHHLSKEASVFLKNRWDGTGKYDNTYTKEDFEQWRKSFYSCSDKTAREHFEKVRMWVEWIFRAAVKSGPKGKRDRFPAVYQSLIDWLSETREAFDLENEVEEILENETHSVGEIGFSITGLLQDQVRAKAELAEYGYDFSEIKKLFKKRKNGFDWLIIEAESRQVWDPFDGAETIPCRNRKLSGKPKYWLEDWRHFHKRTTGRDWNYGPEINEMIAKSGQKLPDVDPHPRS